MTVIPDSPETGCIETTVPRSAATRDTDPRGTARPWWMDPCASLSQTDSSGWVVNFWVEGPDATMHVIELFYDTEADADAHLAKLEQDVCAMPVKYAIPERPVFVVLCGLAGSGKTTARRELEENHVVLSLDDIVERMASERGETYSQAYEAVLEDANATFWRELEQMIAHGANIVVDRTNLSARDRARLLDMTPNSYKKICILVEVDEDLRRERLEMRARETGKIIPAKIDEAHLAKFEMPDQDEGFDAVLFMDGASGFITRM